MDTETILRAYLALFLVTFGLMRMYYHAVARVSHRGAGRTREAGWVSTLRMAVGIPGLLLLAGWCLEPRWVAWSVLDLPLSLRVAGAALAPLSLAMMLWVHHTLDRNFSPTLMLARGHRLVTGGPYSLVRHPMYTGLLLTAIAVFLMSANWFLGLVTIPGMIFTVIVRIPQEEAMMIDQFGDQYRQYMKRTGRLLPVLAH